MFPCCAHDAEYGQGKVPHSEQASQLVGRPKIDNRQKLI